MNASTSPWVGIRNHYIKNNVDQQQRHTQQDLFGRAEFFHFLISYFYAAIQSTMRNSLFYNFFNNYQRNNAGHIKETYNQVLMRFFSTVNFKQGLHRYSLIPT